MLALRRKQDEQRLTDGLIGRVAEDSFRCRVPAGDEPVEVLANDRILRRFHDGGQPRARFVIIDRLWCRRRTPEKGEPFPRQQRATQKRRQCEFENAHRCGAGAAPEKARVQH